MYVTAERLAIADRAIIETFKQTSIAWQAFPNWNVGDPAQSRVRSDVLDTPEFLDLLPENVSFQATLAQLGAPTPDSLLAEVMAQATKLAAQVDRRMFTRLRDIADPQQSSLGALSAGEILTALIRARAKVEDAGYRAPSCLITNTSGLIALNALTADGPSADALLKAANINSLHRTSLFTDADADGNPTPPSDADPAFMLLIGRRERMAHGAASEASPGEEPVDLAISVPPSLEILGEAPPRELRSGRNVMGRVNTGDIELGLRIRFAARVTDPKGVVRLTATVA